MNIIANRDMQLLEILDSNHTLGKDITLIVDSKQGELALQHARKLCKGKYQLALIEGKQNWSGSDLRGMARDWARKYAISRQHLLNRLNNNNIPFHMRDNKYGKNIIILGVW